MNNNSWNKIRYTLYTPIYDVIAGIFKASRKKSIDALNIKTGDKILIVGAGTGLDLEFLPNDCEIIATDLTPSMVAEIEKRNLKLKKNVKAIVMDGHKLEFINEQFDKIILHLILAVLPDPIACIKECERVLKPNGEIAVFDKFVSVDQKVSTIRKAFNLISNFLFSDITRKIEDILKNTNLKMISNEAADFNGNFRVIKIKNSL
jgi:phosphatidylethanolamine/phosphatidyl-N-methylethanolamine N-methyltransferase